MDIRTWQDPWEIYLMGHRIQHPEDNHMFLEGPPPQVLVFRDTLFLHT